MHLLKQSTAASVLVGPVLDSTGAAYTGMAIGDFNLTKNGTSAAMASAATATHDHNGHYVIALTTGNTDTLGRIVISCNKATYAMSASRSEVLTAATFDAIVTNAAGTAGGLPLSLASAKVTAVLAATDVTGNVAADIQTIKSQAVTCAGGVTVPAATLASTANITTASGVSLAASQHVIVDSGTVTTLTNLPSIPTNWITATGITAAALNGKGDWSMYAGGAVASVTAGVTLAASQHVIVDSGTVTTLTNLPAVTTDWLTAAGVKADAVTKIQTGLATPTNITAATGVALAASQHVIVDSGTVTTLTNLPAITTNWLTGTGTDATAVTKIQAGLATPTNITAASGVALASSQHVIVDSGTITTLTNLPSIPTNWLTGTGTDATAVTKIQTGLATPTNITAATGVALAASQHVIVDSGTITTCTNLTNAATAGDLTSTMKTSVTTAATAATPTAAAVTGAVGSVTGNVGGNVTGSVGSVVSATIKKNTALTNFEFMMTDSTSHAPATGKTVTCTRSIDGGSFASGTLANVAEVAFGMYRVDFGAGDLNGGVITLRAIATASDDTFITLTTTP